jgi:hypothetical protein
MFQWTKATKEETRKLVGTINRSVGDEPLSDQDLNRIFDALWPGLEATIRNLPPLDQSKAVERNAGEILAEILEIVRADSNRRRKIDHWDKYLDVFDDFLPMLRDFTRAMKSGQIAVPAIPGVISGESTAGRLTSEIIENIKSVVRRQQKFLAEIIEHANSWEIAGNEVRISFPPASRALADMLSGRGPSERLRGIVSDTIGRPVRICVNVADA